MSDALSDGARAAAQADAYLDYLEVLKDYLESSVRAGGSFSRFMSRASEVSEHLRGWGGYRLNLTDEEGHEYLDKLAAKDEETWATLLRTARLERSGFVSLLQYHFSPFADKVLLFFDSRPGSFQVETISGSRDMLKAGGVSRDEKLDIGKYLIALPIPSCGAVVVRADKKLPPKK